MMQNDHGNSQNVRTSTSTTTLDDISSNVSILGLNFIKKMEMNLNFIKKMENECFCGISLYGTNQKKKMHEEQMHSQSFPMFINLYGILETNVFVEFIYYYLILIVMNMEMVVYIVLI